MYIYGSTPLHVTHEIDGTVILEITDEKNAGPITLHMLEVTFNISRYDYYRSYFEDDSTVTYYDYKDRTYYIIVYSAVDAWIVDESFDINNPSFEDAFLMMEEVYIGNSFHPIFLNCPGITNTDKSVLVGISDEPGFYYFRSSYPSNQITLHDEIGITKAYFSEERVYAASFLLKGSH